MPDYRDLIRFVHGPVPAKPLPAVWDFFPCHAGAVGGVPNFVHYYFDVCEKLCTQIKLRELLPESLILPGVFPDLGVVVDASAFGGRVQWCEQGAPFIGRALRDATDIDTLQPPPVGLCGLMPLWLTQRDVMRRKLQERGEEMERWIMCMGPAEVSGLLMGYESFYLNLYDDPQRTMRLLSLVTDFLSEWLKKQNEVVGGAEVMCVADHVCSQIKAKQLHKFLLPCMRALYASLAVPVKIYHNEGWHSDDHIAAVMEFGADVWHFGSDAHSLAELFSKVGNRIVLFGGLNPHGVMRNGTPEQVREATRKAMEAARGHRLLLSTGTGTTPDTTLENLRAMVETVVQG